MQGRSWLRTRYPYLAGGVALLLVVNFVIFNFQTGGQTLSRTANVSQAYARTKGSGAELILGNVQRLGLGVLRTLSGAIEIRPNPGDYLTDPVVVGAGLLAVGGGALQLRRRQPLLILAVLSYLGLLVLFNAKYEVIPNARFLTVVLPPMFVSTSVLLTAIVARVHHRQRLAWIGTGAVVGTLVLASLLGLARRYEQMAGSAQASAMVRTASDTLAEVAQAEMPVLLDRGLDRLYLDGGGDLYLALRFELVRRQVPWTDLPGRLRSPTGDINPCDRYDVLLIPIDRTSATPDWLAPALGTDLSLVPHRFWTLRTVPRAFSSVTDAPEARLLFSYSAPRNGSARTVDRCQPGRLI